MNRRSCFFIAGIVALAVLLPQLLGAREVGRSANDAAPADDAASHAIGAAGGGGDIGRDRIRPTDAARPEYRGTD